MLAIFRFFSPILTIGFSYIYCRIPPFCASLCFPISGIWVCRQTRLNCVHTFSNIFLNIATSDSKIYIFSKHSRLSGSNAASSSFVYYLSDLLACSGWYFPCVLARENEHTHHLQHRRIRRALLSRFLFF